MSGKKYFSMLPLLYLVVTVLLVLQGNFGYGSAQQPADSGFARANGTHFARNGKSLYLNGFNAYWMMYMASDPSTRAKVTATFEQASKYGMNVARTWAFRDGGYRPLQSSPGSYNEDVFRGLDFVISEAGRHGVHLILSLVNNFEDFGGRKQNVKWARDRGQNLNNDDDFYTNSVVKEYYKNHIKTVLTRNNSMTGMSYKDDPIIFAWELMNEPRCQTDPSGKYIQEWVREMAGHVKSIDGNHLLEIGLEGFYGETVPERLKYNPREQVVGTDFISNNQLPEIDFATIHIYPEQWLAGSDDETQSAFVDKWVQTHIEDSNSVLKKPLLLGEFGKSSRLLGYSLEGRDAYFRKLYKAIYSSAKSGGPFVGGLFWQLMAQGMDNFRDGYEVVLEESPSTASVIAQQSHMIFHIPHEKVKPLFGGEEQIVETNA